MGWCHKKINITLKNQFLFCFSENTRALNTTTNCLKYIFSSLFFLFPPFACLEKKSSNQNSQYAFNIELSQQASHKNVAKPFLLFSCWINPNDDEKLHAILKSDPTLKRTSFSFWFPQRDLFAAQIARVHAHVGNCSSTLASSCF
jgi:hypothetical protein